MSHWYPTHWKTGVASGSDSTDYQCLTATRSTIRLLGLSGLANDSVVVKKLPLERIVRGSEAIAMPAVLLTPRPEIINPYAGTNVKDDIGYGVLVSILAEDNQEPTLAANLEKYLSWPFDRFGVSESAAGRSSFGLYLPRRTGRGHQSAGLAGQPLRVRPGVAIHRPRGPRVTQERNHGT